MKTVLISFSFLLALASCGGHSEEKLFGKWTGMEVTEKGMPLKIDPSEVKFEFWENGLYAFHGTLNYREAGTFKIKGDLLYTLDTINEASSEKAVQVIQLTADSLFLKMQSAGKERLVKLGRVGN